jgi:kynurenine formamidase
MDHGHTSPVVWEKTSVRAPDLPSPVPVIAAKDVPYVLNGHRFQTFTVYLRRTTSNESLLGLSATRLPACSDDTQTTCLVHIHGGAWRDPFLTSRSIEAAVAYAFSSDSSPIDTVIGINYILSPFPTHPTAPYDPWRENDPGIVELIDAERDPAREGRHPMHIHDVLAAFDALRRFGLEKYLLSGHSCGACIMFQTLLQPPAYWGFHNLPPAPRPVAAIGLNGLYDLPALVHDLGPKHAQMRSEYRRLQGIAFGDDEKHWSEASPALFETERIQHWMQSSESSVPSLVVIDQSPQDQLVPVNQMERLRGNLDKVSGLHVTTGRRCVGSHAAPWEEGQIIWETVQDVLTLLQA